MFLLERYSDDLHINLGSGEEIAIRDLAALVARVVGFDGEVVTDPTKPDGTPRKLMSTARLAAMGWHPSIALADGIADAYEAFLTSAEVRGTQ